MFKDLKTLELISKVLSIPSIFSLPGSLFFEELKTNLLGDFDTFMGVMCFTASAFLLGDTTCDREFFKLSELGELADTVLVIVFKGVASLMGVFLLSGEV